MFLTGLLSFAILNLDNFIIGSVSGAEKLGYYAIAFNWGSMVCSIMGAVVFSVLFPTFSRMRGDNDKLKQSYLKILQYTALFSLLCNVGLFCVADNFLVSVLGKGTDKWLPSLATLRILCVYGCLRSLIEPASSLLMSQGDTKTPLRAGILVALVETALVYPAVRFGGIEAVGSAVLVSYACQLFFFAPVMKRAFSVTAGEVWELVWPALAAGGAMVACYFSFSGLYQDGLAKLAVSIVALSAVYLAAYGFFTRWRVFAGLKELLPQARAL